MASRRKLCVDRTAARLLYYAVNQLRGVPRRSTARGLRRPLSVVEGGRGWVKEHARIVRIDGAYWVIVTDADVAELHGQSLTLRDGTEYSVDLSLTVPHVELDRQIEEAPSILTRITVERSR